MKKLFALIICFGSLSAIAEDLHFVTVKVISQNIDTSDNGVAVVPMGTILAGVPIRRQTNTVVVETSKARLTLVEDAKKHFLVLPVNGTVQSAKDGKWIIILDSNKKKHKFGIVHAEMLPTGIQK